MAYIQLGDRDNAAASLDKTLKLNPGHSSARKELIRFKQVKGDRPGTASGSGREAAPPPDQAGAHIRLAQTYLGLKRPGDAWKEFTKARELGYDEKGAYLLGARILSALGRTREASKWLEQADGNDPQAKELRDRLVTGTGAGARTPAESAPAAPEAPRDPQAAYRAGLAAERSNKFTEAAEAYRQAIESNPSHYPALLGLGRTYFNLKQYQEALNVLHQARSIKTDDPDLFNCVGSCYYGLGEYSTAIPHFEEAVALDPADVNSLNNLGQTYKSAGRPADALKTWWQSLNLRSDQPHIRREYDALTPTP
jgi:tetratricopeptide (TPR) repeat protein